MLGVPVGALSRWNVTRNVDPSKVRLTRRLLTMVREAPIVTVLAIGVAIAIVIVLLVLVVTLPVIVNIRLELVMATTLFPPNAVPVLVLSSIKTDELMSLVIVSPTVPSLEVALVKRAGVRMLSQTLNLNS